MMTEEYISTTIKLKDYVVLVWLLHKNGDIEFDGNAKKVKSLKNSIERLKDVGLIEYSDLLIHKVFATRFGKIWKITLKDFRCKEHVIDDVLYDRVRIAIKKE